MNCAVVRETERQRLELRWLVASVAVSHRIGKQQQDTRSRHHKGATCVQSQVTSRNQNGTKAKLYVYPPLGHECGTFGPGAHVTSLDPRSATCSSSPSTTQLSLALSSSIPHPSKWLQQARSHSLHQWPKPCRCLPAAPAAVGPTATLILIPTLTLTQVKVCQWADLPCKSLSIPRSPLSSTRCLITPPRSLSKRRPYREPTLPRRTPSWSVLRTSSRTARPAAWITTHSTSCTSSSARLLPMRSHHRRT